MAGGCRRAWRSTTSVHAPGPVRSSVSTFVFLLNTCPALRTMWSHMSRSAGCPGAPANVHCSTCVHACKGIRDACGQRWPPGSRLLEDSHALDAGRMRVQQRPAQTPQDTGSVLLGAKGCMAHFHPAGPVEVMDVNRISGSTM